MDEGTDIRGRAVVWTAGIDRGAVADERRRVWLGRLALAAVSLAALVALVTGTAAWSVLTPVGSDPNTPLWIAPPKAVTHDGTTPSATAARRSTPAAAPTASEKLDDHGHHHVSDNSARGRDHVGTDDKGDRRRGGDDHAAPPKRSGLTERGRDDGGGSGGRRASGGASSTGGTGHDHATSNDHAKGDDHATGDDPDGSSSGRSGDRKTEQPKRDDRSKRGGSGQEVEHDEPKHSGGADD